MIDEKLTALEIIGIAIRAEQDAYKLYSAMAALVSRPELKTELERLAGEEQNHERWLTAYYRQATGEESPPPVPDVQITLFGPEVHDGMTLLKVLDVAIEKERAAETVYAEAQRRSNDPSGKRLLGELVEFERGHARKLGVFREEIARNPSWQEDAAGRTIQLEGP